MCQGRGAFTLRYLHSTIDSTTSNTMTTHNLELELQCLIIGQTNTFTIEINAEKQVNQLKEAIAAKNKDAFQKIDIDAKDLTLYSIVVEEDGIDETLPRLMWRSSSRCLLPTSCPIIFWTHSQTTLSSP